MQYEAQIMGVLKKILDLSQHENKPSGFCIGNTAKIDGEGLYLTPLRNMSSMILSGVIVYSEKLAAEVARMVDGVVDYVLVDAEKKVPDGMSFTGVSANVERIVRETVKQSDLWVYKGNDLAVEAIDGLLTHLTRNSVRGIGGKKVAILGSGNLGSKLALKLVERGAQVYITRRNKEKINLIANALNCIKSKYTSAQVTGMVDNYKAAYRADILIGLTKGTPIISSAMVESLQAGALIFDGGKGCLHPEAIRKAESLGIDIYRLDIAAALEGKISSLFAIENIVDKEMGRRVLSKDFVLVSGGLMGRKGEIVVDNIYDPKVIYGIANGSGDFIRNLSDSQRFDIVEIKKMLEIGW
jgi:hypothetical protein